MINNGGVCEYIINVINYIFECVDCTASLAGTSTGGGGQGGMQLSGILVIGMQTIIINCKLMQLPFVAIASIHWILILLLQATIGRSDGRSRGKVKRRQTENDEYIHQV